MTSERKQKLTALGPERLADALLKLASQSDAANDLVERMIAAPGENIKRFKRKVAGLKRSRRFISWRASAAFAGELENLLEDLEAGNVDPMTGVELLASFYETDVKTFERCDDSGGHVGDVYRYDAKDLFADFALQCEDKENVGEVIIRLCLKDDYCVRDALIENAGEFLPEKVIRSMIASFQASIGQEKREYEIRHRQRLIESLARQIKDPAFFEKMRTASRKELTAHDYIEISRAYLESGDVQTALSWAEKIPKNAAAFADERNHLLIEIYRITGNRDQLTEMLHRKFKSHHSVENLQELLDVVGNDRKDKVIADEVSGILRGRNLNLDDAHFLISIDRLDEAEVYLLERTEQIQVMQYPGLVPLAKNLASEGRSLAAAMIYRTVLMSILDRGYSKAYPHGVRYLKMLDRLAEEISDWKDFNSHAAFKEVLTRKHGRKYSFWSRYEKKA